jgi:hypothetical protein
MKNAYPVAQAVSRQSLAAKATPQINYGKTNIIPIHAMKAYRRSSGKLQSFLTLALDDGGW